MTPDEARKELARRELARRQQAQPTQRPADIPERGTPEYNQRMAELQAGMDAGQQQSDSAQSKLNLIKPVLGAANLGSRFANSATLGVPNRILSTAQAAGDALSGQDNGPRHAQLKGQLEDVRQQFPKSSLGADVGGGIFGVGKVSAAKALPSQLAAKIAPKLAQGGGRLGSLARSTAGLGLDGALIAGTDALVDGRDALKEATTGGLMGAGLNVLTRGAGAGLSKAFKGKKPAVPSTKDLKRTANANYKKIDDLGVTFTDGALGALKRGVSDDLLNPNVALDKAVHPATSRIMKDLNALKGDVPFTKLEQIRKRAERVGGGKFGGEDSFAAKIVSDNIDKFLASSPQVTSASAPSNTIKEAIDTARGSYRQFKSAESVEDAIQRAVKNTQKSGSGGNFDNNVRRALDSLQNGKKGKFLDAEVKAGIDGVVKGSAGANAARLGGKLSPTSGGLTTLLSLGAAGATGGSSLLLNGLGFASKQIADKATKRKANDLLRQIQAGSKQVAARPDTKLSKAVADKKRQDEIARIFAAAGISGF